MQRLIRCITSVLGCALIIMLSFNLSAKADSGFALSNIFTLDTRDITIILTIAAISPIIADGISASIITITVKDSTSKPIPNKTVSISATGSDNIISQPSAPTNQNGMTTAKLKSTKAETKTVSIAVDGTSIATTAKVEFLPDVVNTANSTIVASGSAIADGTSQIKLTITLFDANKNPIKDKKIIISALGTGNLITQPTTLTDQNGVTTTFISSTKAEDKTINAVVAGDEIKLKPIVITFTPPPLPKLVVRATSPHIADGEDTSTIILVLTDAKDNPLPNKSLKIAATGTGNILIQPESLTEPSGRTTAKLKSTKAEIKTITATHEFEGQKLQATTTVEFQPSPKPLLPSPPTQLTVSGNIIKSDNVSAVEITGKANPNAQVTIALKDGINTVQRGVTSDAIGLFKVIADAASLKDGNITVVAAEVGGQEASITVIKDTKAIAIEKPEFVISALSSTQSAEVGKSAIYIINLLSKGGFKSDLTLRISDPPKGVEAEFNPKVASISSENPLSSPQLTIRVGNNTPVGDHKFIVSAVALDKSIKEIELQLQVKPPSLKNSFITMDVEPTQPRLEDKLKVKGEIIFEGEEVKVKLPITISYKPADGKETTQSIQTDGSGRYIGEVEVNQKGKWEFTVSWEGDKTYKSAKKSMSVEALKGLSQIKWQPSQTVLSGSIKVGSVIKVVGSLKSLIKGEPLKNETVSIDVIKPGGIKRTQKATTNEFGNFEFDVLFDSEGTWQIETSWDGNENYLTSKSEILSVPVTKESAKAIIVLGGGSESENPAWNQFAGLANYVYKTLRRRDLTDDDIYYLSPTEKTLASVDSKTSKDALKFAITDWAKKRTSKNVPLFIYFLSHNLNDKFLLEKLKDREVILTPEDLASWLDVLDKDAEVTLIIEACFSGNFIAKKLPTGEPVLSRSNRVIITSAKEDKQALILRDLSSFSKAFFDQVVRNESINMAFLKGRDSTRALRSLQSPQIDANGDGRPNDPTRDFPAVEKKYIPEFRLYLASVPEIKEAIAKPNELKAGMKSAIIEVKVVGTDITNVFANVVPPNFDPDKSFTDWNDLNLSFDQIKFQKILEGVYKGEYNNFILPGEYSIVVHAENPDGSAVPSETTIKVLLLSWDVNADGEVNIFDLVIVASNIGQEVKNGDVNGDGKVDIFDLVTVASHFGEKSVASPSIQPEQTKYSQYLPLLERAYELLQSSSNPSPEFEKARKLLERLISLAKSVAKETELLPNYPNPFNPETWIPYQLSESADVMIQIYDITGGLIRTLSLGRKLPGLYISKERTAHWDGKNNIGEPVASGIYYYRMQAGRFESVRKMVIAK